MKPICKKCNKVNCTCGLNNKPQNISCTPSILQKKPITQCVDKVPDIDHRLLDKVVKVIQTDNYWYIQLDSGQYYKVPDINVIRKEKRYKIIDHTLSKEKDENGNELDNWILDILDSDNDNFPVDMKDFISWMSKKFKFKIQQDPNDPNTYIFVNEDGDVIDSLTVGDEDTDISAYKGIYNDSTGIVTITVRDNKTLQDVFTFDIDVGYLKNAPDKYVTDLNYSTTTKKLRLQRSDGEELSTDIPIPTLPAKIVTNITQNGDTVTVTYQDGSTSTITVGGNGKLPDPRNITIEEPEYTPSGEDFNGNTIIRMNNPSLMVTFNLVKPPIEADFINKSIIVRKTGGDQDTLCDIVCGTDVTIIPADANVLRRVGSTYEFVYIGNGVYDAYGELA